VKGSARRPPPRLGLQAAAMCSSSPLAVAATSAEAKGWPETREPGASLIRLLSLQLKPNAAPAPRNGSGPGAEAEAAGNRVAGA
jgi:hypothetical protein